MRPSWIRSRRPRWRLSLIGYAVPSRYLTPCGAFHHNYGMGSTHGIRARTGHSSARSPLLILRGTSGRKAPAFLRCAATRMCRETARVALPRFPSDELLDGIRVVFGFERHATRATPNRTSVRGDRTTPLEGPVCLGGISRGLRCPIPSHVQGDAEPRSPVHDPPPSSTAHIAARETIFILPSLPGAYGD